MFAAIVSIGVAAIPKLLLAFSFTSVLLYLYLVFPSLALFESILPKPLSWSREAEIPDAIRIDRGANVLLVTAHPDDECMFFGPSVVGILRRRKMHTSRMSDEREKNVSGNLSVLCLSIGNHDALGSRRREELVKSCVEMGIDVENVFVIDHQQLQDCPTIEWPPTIIADVVSEYIQKLGITTIITFDAHGVSGHINHISVYHGIRHLLLESSPSSPPSRSLLISGGESTVSLKAYSLHTVSILRKYMTIFDLPYTAMSWFISCLRNGEDTGVAGQQLVFFISTPKEINRTKSSMYRHQSQLLWFRRLYVWFSRYMVVNELIEMNLPLDGMR